MIFIDASAMVSMIIGDADADDLSNRLERVEARICSAISIWETQAALCLSYKFSPKKVRGDVASFILAARLQYVPIGERESELAALAYEKFGKGRHPAALNMGDCFAYACAKANNAKLLFKGDDFAKTDIAAA